MRNQQSRVHFADAISPQPAFVFVLPAEAADATPPSCAICLSEVPPAERFRFSRKTEESYHSGFRNLSAAGTFSEELMYCRRASARFLPAVAWHCAMHERRCDAMRCALTLAGFRFLATPQPRLPPQLRAVVRGARHPARGAVARALPAQRVRLPALHQRRARAVRPHLQRVHRLQPAEDGRLRGAAAAGAGGPRGGRRDARLDCGKLRRLPRLPGACALRIAALANALRRFVCSRVHLLCCRRSCSKMWDVRASHAPATRASCMASTAACCPEAARAARALMQRTVGEKRNARTRASSHELQAGGCADERQQRSERSVRRLCISGRRILRAHVIACPCAHTHHRAAATAALRAERGWSGELRRCVHVRPAAAICDSRSQHSRLVSIVPSSPPAHPAWTPALRPAPPWRRLRRRTRSG